MNYQHNYHAGSFADVAKHLMLLCILTQLQQKSAGICYLETHAGRGRYALNNTEALKTREFDLGISKIAAFMRHCEEHHDKKIQKNSTIKMYLEAISKLQIGKELTVYPGSPLFAYSHLRPQDQMILCELHPIEVLELKREFWNEPRVAVHHQDGYLALKAFLPPKLTRGLILIDPPYEKNDEFEVAKKNLIAAVARFPTGVFMLWYPIKKESPAVSWYVDLEESNLPNLLQAELRVLPKDSPVGLTGTGMLIVNPPWRSEESIKEILGLLADILGIDGQGSMKLHWMIKRV